MADDPRPADGGVGLGSEMPLPRVTIRFCTQCKWMLRAAYFAQELLSTFSTSLGEVALQPGTGGVFTVEIFHTSSPAPAASEPSTTSHPSPSPTVQHRILWDRKTDGGFPETKELKRRVRDVIEPGRDLGHVDRDHRKEKAEAAAAAVGAVDAVVGSPSAAASGGVGGEEEEGVPTSPSTGNVEEKRSLEPPVQICRITSPEEGGGEGGKQGDGEAKCEDCA